MNGRLLVNHALLATSRKFLLFGGLFCVVQGFLPSACGQGIDEAKYKELLAIPLPTEPSELLAVVGDKHILVGDILPKVERQLLSMVKGDISQIPPDELKVAKTQMMRALLSRTIQLHMLGNYFLISRVGSASAEQRRDATQQMQLQATKSFYEVRVPSMMEELELDSAQAVDAKLRENGSSLEIAKEDYVNSVLGQLMLQQMVPQDPEVTLQEIRYYYDTHRDEFHQRAQSRWEQLTVLFANFSSREAAMQAISEMGREAYFGGNVQKVAKEKSQEPLAASGGVHDWTGKGSLRSKALDEQIFSIPVNRLSQIIEDEDGYHIVRVLERKEEGYTPLSEVQDEIREKLKEEKISAAEKELMEKLRQAVPVWTRFPEDVPGSKSLEQVARFGAGTKRR